MSNSIWSTNVDDFAVRMTLDDLPGLLSKQLVVEPGTRALIVDGGVPLGDVSPGTYTLKSFSDKLKFWRQDKQVDVVLVRDEDVRSDFRIEQIPTAEGLLVAIRVQMILKIEDIALFTKNLLGTRPSMKLEDITKWIQPIITQALRESVRGLSIDLLTSPDVRPILATAIQDATKTSMLRYGIVCIGIHTVEIVNEQYDEQLKKTGEIFLLNMETQQQKELNEVLSKETFQKIERHENENELAVLLENVELDREEAKVAMMNRLNEIRKKRRSLDSVDKLDELKYRQELEEIAATIAQAQKIKTLEREIEFAKLAESEDSRKWEERLRCEIRDSNSRFQERMTKLKQDHEINTKNAENTNAEELRQVKHDQSVVQIILGTERMRDEYADEQERREFANRKARLDIQIENLRRMQADESERNRAADEQRHRHEMEASILAADIEKTRIAASVKIKEYEATSEARVTERERELSEQSRQDMKEFTDKTLHTVTTITGLMGGTIVQMGTGGNVVPGLGGTPGVIICTHCRTNNSSGNKYCTQCGKEL